MLANLLSQQSSQASLGSNPFFSAPLEVPDIPPPGSTGGRGSESLKRGRFASPSGVVPPVSEDDVMPPINVSMPCSVASWGVARVPGPPYPPFGDFTPVSGDSDQLCSHGVSGFTQHVVSADIHDVPRSVASFNPTSLLFPFSDSGVSSLSSLTPSSLPASGLLSFLPSVSSAPPTTVPLFSLPLVVPSVLPFSSTVSAPSSAPSSFASFYFSYPSGLVSSAPSLPLSSPHLGPLAPSSSSFPVVSVPAPLAPGSSWLSSVSHPSAPASSSGVSSSPSASSFDDFGAVQARVLGLSSEYQVVARWFSASGGGGGVISRLMSLLISLTSTLTFTVTSLLALPVSFLPCLQLLLLLRLRSLLLLRSLPSALRRLAFRLRLLSRFSLLLLLAPLSLPLFASLLLRWLRSLLLLLFLCVLFLLFLRLRLCLLLCLFLSAPLAFLLGLRAYPPKVASLPGIPGSSGVSLASAFPVCSSAPPQVPSLFRHFASLPSSSVPVSSAPPPVTSGCPPFSSFSFAFDSSAAPPDPSSSFSFGLPDDLLEDSPPDALPHVFDPVSSALPESARSEFCRMMSFIVDLFPQAAGSPSVPPPPRALFEDFFSSSVPPPPPIFLDWFERIRSALADADSRLACFVASVRGDYLFLPSRSSTYAVHGDFAFSGASPANPSLLSLFERRLKPTHHVGLTIREAAVLEASLRSQSEDLSHSMWLLSALLGFVQLQNFAPEDSSLFNTLVTSFSKGLAHQASLTATHTAFVGLKRREFYLSHLPAYFSAVNKRAMLSSSRFSYSDVQRWLEDTQTSSSLRSQQALVEVASRGAGARSRRSSPFRSPSRSSSARRKRRESGSPSCSGKCVQFDSPAPNSALKGPKSGFRR